MASMRLLFVLLITLALSISCCLGAFSPRPIRHYVNGRQGWVPHPFKDYNQWAGSNRFLVHDTLLFRYNKEQDSVLEVSKEDYDSCNTEHPIEKKQDGESEFDLKQPGPYYFISGNKTHCQQGQKLIVQVLHYPSTLPSPPASSPGSGSHHPTPVTPSPPGAKSPATSPASSTTPGTGGPATSPSSGTTPGAAGPATSPSSGTPVTAGPAMSPSSGTPTTSGPATSPTSATSPTTSGPAAGPAGAASPPAPIAAGPGASAPGAAAGPGSAAPGVAAGPGSAAPGAAAGPGSGEPAADVTSPAPSATKQNSAAKRGNGFSMGVGVLGVFVSLIMWLN